MKSQKPTTLTISQLDLEKRYDIYHHVRHEERLYENVKLVAIRTLDGKSGYMSMASYLEIEAVYGSRMLLSSYGIHMICEHGTKPMFKVYKSWANET